MLLGVGRWFDGHHDPLQTLVAQRARRALAEDVVLAPGNAFSVSGAATSFVRFNVAQMDGDKVYAALRRAMA